MKTETSFPAYNPHTDRPKRLPKGTPPEDAALYYEKAGRAQMEADNWWKSEVYFEWARLERLKMQSNQSAAAHPKLSLA